MTEPYYERREITDFRDLINQSTAIYGNKNAFLLKKVHYSAISPLSVAALASKMRTLTSSPICLPCRGKMTVLY